MDSLLRSPKILAALIVAGAILMMALFGWPLVTGEVFVEHDVGSVLLPWKFFYHQCLERGVSFIWNPHLFGGYYIHAEGAAGMAHPVYYVLHRFLPFTYAFDLEILLHYPFMFLGMFLFLRRWNLPRHAAYFGALFFAFSGYPMNSWLWSIHIGVLAHGPWLLLAIDVAMRSEDRKKIALAVCAIALLTGSALLVGYPQMVYIVGLAEALYVLFLLPSTRNRRYIPLLAMAKLLGILCAAIQVLPTLDILAASTRTEVDNVFRMQQSLHPFNLFCLVNPYLFHQRMYDANGYQGLYGGVVLTLLAAWSVLRFRVLPDSKRLMACAIAMVVLGGVLTLGRHGGLYYLMSYIPVVEKFRGPARHGALFHIGWVLMGALAYRELWRLVEARKKIRWKEIAPLLALPAVSVAIAIGVVVLRLLPEVPAVLEKLDAEFAPTRNAVFGAFFMLGATAFFVLTARGWRYGLIALTLFAIFDLSWYGFRHRTTANLDEFVAGIDVPDAPPGYRIEPNWLPMYDVNGPMMKGYGTMTGNTSLYPNRRIAYNLQTTPLRLAGVRWLRSRIGTTVELNQYAEAGIEWIELSEPMPRVRLVSKAQVSADPNADIYTVDFATVVLVDTPIELEEGTPGTAAVIEDTPGKIRVRTAASTRQVLVTTESYYPGWTVTLDGESIEVIPLYGDFLGCVLPAGEHEVEFDFDPASYRYGKALSFAGLALTLALYFLLKRLLKPTGGKE